jgi:hypothetical protein
MARAPAAASIAPVGELAGNAASFARHRRASNVSGRTVARRPYASRACAPRTS